MRVMQGSFRRKDKAMVKSKQATIIYTAGSHLHAGRGRKDSDSMTNIRNIFCVGRNYATHAKELGNAIPTSPFFFMKPTNAVVFTNGQPIAFPADQGSVHYEVEIVIRMSKKYEPGMKLDEVIDQMALGVDFTLRDVQDGLKQKQLPWLLAKGFPNSALLTPFHPFPGEAALRETNFSLQKNGEVVQNGNVSQMLFDLQALIDFATKHLGLDAGDLIYTGTPAGVGPVADGDRLSLYWGEQLWGECSIALG